MELEEGSKAGCHLCTTLLEAILPEKAIIGLERGDIGQSRFRIHMLYAVEGWVLQIRHLSHGTRKIGGDLPVTDLLLERVDRSTDDTTQRIWNLLPDIAEPQTRTKAVQTLSGTNVNPEAIQQIREWLRTCTEEHVECGGYGGAKPLPPNSSFRLVDVGAHLGDKVRLIEVGGDQGAGNLQHDYDRYITLSYRWTDEVKETRLTADNKTDFEESISTNGWPKVYRDAVSIAHQLGVRYLWIDSLCIIQDQREDWIKQAALMGDIYSRGFLNLAAVEGPGLEVLRNPLRVAPCLLTLHMPRSDYHATKVLCYRPADIRKAVDRAPLYKRGWCFQERVLSRRSVHFGDQIFWECAALRASETFPLRTDVPMRPEYLDTAIHDMKVALRSENRPPGASLHRLWCSVVRCYSQTELTKPSDRVIALRGIANTMARQLGLVSTDFLAGIWKPGIAFQLLWARESKVYSDADKRLTDQLENHFPSWSWASCPGETRFIELDIHQFSWSLIRLDGAQASDDAACSANASFLVLRGWPVRCNQVEDWLARQNRGREKIFQFPSTSTGGGVLSTEPVAVTMELDKPVSEPPVPVCLLPVLSSFGFVTGLILGSVGTRQGMVAYRRLGYFRSGSGTRLVDMLAPESMGQSLDNLEAVYDTLRPFILL